MSLLWDMLLDPAWVSFWAAMAAFAGFLQALILAVTACFVRRYLRATEALVESTRSQVSESRKLVETAQRQLDVSQNQLEAQIRPALVMFTHGTFQIENVGSGAGLNLNMVEVASGAAVDWASPANAENRLTGAFVAPGKLQAQESGIPQNFYAGRGCDLHIFYESLSGRRYASVVTFGGNGLPADTRFRVRE